MKFLIWLVVISLGMSGSVFAKEKTKAADSKEKPQINISVACDVQTNGSETSKSELAVTVDLNNPSLEILAIEIFEDFKTQIAGSSTTKVTRTQSVAKFDSKYCAENEIRIQVTYRKINSEEKLKQIQAISLGQVQ